MIYHERNLDRIDFVADAQRTLDLPRNNVIRGLYLRLTGRVTTTATAPVGLRSHAEHRLIRRIEIVANGKDTIKSHPFLFSKMLTNFDFGTPSEIATIGVTVSTNFDFIATAFVPFAFTRAKRPVDGALDARRLQTLDLRVTFGNINDVYATPNGATITNTVLNVVTHEYINAPVDFQAFLNKHSTIEREVTATTASLQERLPVDRIYRRFFLYSEEGMVARNDIINNITLQSGSFVFKSLESRILQSQMKVQSANELIIPGLYVIEAITDGRIVESINTMGMSSLEFVLNVTRQTPGVNTILIVPEVVEG